MRNIVACGYIQSVPLFWEGGKVHMAEEKGCESEVPLDRAAFSEGRPFPEHGC